MVVFVALVEFVKLVAESCRDGPLGPGLKVGGITGNVSAWVSSVSIEPECPTTYSSRREAVEMRKFFMALVSTPAESANAFFMMLLSCLLRMLGFRPVKEKSTDTVTMT